jgi:hypothetical protein
VTTEVPESMQTFYQPGVVAGDTSHRCPICARLMPACARYPAYLCGACAGRAVDADGQPLVYVSGGGMGGSSVEGPGKNGVQKCYVDDVPCVVGEARFGGFVMEVRDPFSPTVLDVKKLNVQQLLVSHSAALAELRTRNVVRTGNNPTGDYVEWLVAARLGLTLEANSAIGFDACGPDGTRYQIKGRRLASAKGPAQLGVIRNLQAFHFDFLIAVVMNDDWSVRYAAKIPHAALASMAKFQSHVNGHVLWMKPSLLDVESVEDLSTALG